MLFPLPSPRCHLNFFAPGLCYSALLGGVSTKGKSIRNPCPKSIANQLLGSFCTDYLSDCIIPTSDIMQCSTVHSLSRYG